MNTVLQQLHETQPPASATHVAQQSKTREEKKANAPAESGFNALMSAITPVACAVPGLQMPAAQTPAPGEAAVHESGSPSKTAETQASCNTQTPRTEDQNADNTQTPTVKQATDGAQAAAKQQDAPGPIQAGQGNAQDTKSPNATSGKQDSGVPSLTYLLIPTSQGNGRGKESPNPTDGKQDSSEPSLAYLLNRTPAARIGTLEKAGPLPAMGDSFTFSQVPDNHVPEAKPAPLPSAPFSTEATAAGTDENYLFPASFEAPVQQNPGVSSGDFVKGLLASISMADLSRPADQKSSSSSMDREGDSGSSPPDKDHPAPGIDTAFASVHDSSLRQQAAQSAGAAVTADKMRPVNAGAGAPAVDPPPDVIGKAYISHDGNRLTIAVEPDGLGKLDINLRLDKGTVMAQIQTSDTASKMLIENNLRQIVNTLLHDGLSVGGFSVSLKHGEAGGYGTGQGMPGQATTPAVDAVHAAGGHSYTIDGRINIFV